MSSGGKSSPPQNEARRVFGAIASAFHLLTVFSLSPERAVFLLGTKFQLLPLSVLSPVQNVLSLQCPLSQYNPALNSPKGLPRLPTALGSSVV